MPRAIYLVVFKSPLFPAHWGLWIPSAADPNIGKRIHASGDAATGFQIFFERNYDLVATRRRYQVLPLAQVLDQHVVDVEGDGSQWSDTTAHDYIEQVALSVPAPARSLISASSQGPKQRVAIQNCQTWLREFVAALVQKGLMDQSALQILDGAPKN
ncbi:hypothetical protein P153DRAFT_327702 [Dothidotthia symphoricarpi CBS 119687]|uniref:Uncharacterized protein n=1 Tax=Dothidotthia symphoricarpi CBS 119687 TaxID=1392245 RepID=A0A6A5ZYV9_9PLEO|nr:uncharacterized protein P153DRAFT_327702 [Dothidotthia symphoricarpi CBS 119687]KAF2123947.1 hypothetical protein P153DRAFT_327702 [Dothidotthia symphoricarpi CBS 119687]